MNVSVSALKLLISAAPDLNGSLVKKIDSNRAHFILTVELLDGSSTVYHLDIYVFNDNEVSVKEVINDLLPSCCPERHINPGGTFCLGWEHDQDLRVTDHESALHWWSILHRFLELQTRARNRKIWPGKEWAHGPAAQFQNKAETAAKALGGEWYLKLTKNKLIVKLATATGLRGRVLRLYIEHKHICSVWLDLDMVANKRQRCLCKPIGKKRPKRIRSCGDHANQIKELIINIYLQGLALQLFWEKFGNQECCNTMKNCPLRGGYK